MGKFKSKDRFKPGDLVEINVPFQVGECVKGKGYKVREAVGDEHLYVEGSSKLYHSSYFNLVTRPATPSPIRTRREIVPGVYGIIEVGEGSIYIGEDFYTSDELREAAHLFNQIAEVLEENANVVG